MTVATIYAGQDVDGDSTSGGGVGTTGVVAGSSATNLAAGAISGCSGAAYYNCSIRMDLSSLVTKYVISATFNYQVTTNNAGINVRAYLATSSWSEGDGGVGPTYDLNDYTGDLDVSTTGAKTSSDSKWTTWVRNWISGATPNYGFVLDWYAGSAYAQISSREGANPEYLSITYASKPVTSAINIGGGSSVPASGNVVVGFTFNDPDGGTLTNVLVRRTRLTGA